MDNKENTPNFLSYVPFEDLTPACYADISNYKQALDQAFAEPDLKKYCHYGTIRGGEK